MKKVIRTITILTALLLLTGCSSRKVDLQPVSIGNLAFNYDASIWEYNENTNESAPLEFSDAEGNTVSIYVSQESTYQHPLDMIRYFETLISTYEDFVVFQEPSSVEVNGETWYEYGYSYKDESIVYKIYQRYYGKYYNAASITYTSTVKAYQTGYDEAVKLMSDVRATAVTNDVNEEKAQEFLVGEWEVTNSGYLVLYDDGTYEWYKDASKDKNNMHHGTYGCDVENATLSLKEGDGIYLVLFPENLTINGTTEESSSAKIDYLISFDKKEKDGYQMVNMSTYTLYTVTKQ